MLSKKDAIFDLQLIQQVSQTLDAFRLVALDRD